MKKPFLSNQLVTGLREMACQGASICMMVQEIRNHLKPVDANSLIVVRYFKEAFLLPLGDLRQIEGSTCLGQKLYDDAQIDHLLLPLIAGTRELWEKEMDD